MNNLVKLFKALSDPNRFRIVSALMHNSELCACQVTELLQITGASVSRHLSLLKDSKLLSSRKDGRWIFFRLTQNQEFGPLIEWINTKIESDPQIKIDIKTLEKILAVDPEEICRKQRGEKCCPKK